MLKEAAYFLYGYTWDIYFLGEICMKKYIVFNLFLLACATEVYAAAGGGGMIGAAHPGENRQDEDGDCISPYIPCWVDGRQVCLTREEIQEENLKRLELGQPIIRALGLKLPKKQKQQERRRALKQEKLAQRRAHGRDALHERYSLASADDGIATVPPTGEPRTGGMRRNAGSVNLTRQVDDVSGLFSGLGLRTPSDEVRDGRSVAAEAVLESADDDAKFLRDYFVRKGQANLGLLIDVPATQTREAQAASKAARLDAPRHHKKRYNSIAGKKRLDREGRHECNLEALRYERGDADGSRGQTPVDAQAEPDGSWGAGGGVPVSTTSAGSLRIARPDDDTYFEEEDGAIAPQAFAQREDFSDATRLRRADKRRRGHDGQVHRDQANGGAVAPMDPAATLPRSNGKEEK